MHGENAIFGGKYWRTSNKFRYVTNILCFKWNPKPLVQYTECRVINKKMKITIEPENRLL